MAEGCREARSIADAGAQGHREVATDAASDFS